MDELSLQSPTPPPGLHQRVQEPLVLDFATVYRVEMPTLTRFVMKHGASPQEAADAAQEAFAQAYTSWDRIHHPSRWLRKVATRLYFRHRFCEDLPGDLPDSQVLVNFELSTEERLVYEALYELPLRQRQVMAWHYDGYSAQEIAEELGIGEAAVRQNLCRARAKLQEIRCTPRGGA